MRGRKPCPLALASCDVPSLQQMARSRSLPWFQVQRARILLAVAAGQRIQMVAFQMQCDEATIWRTCRRYEQAGLTTMLADKPRTGRPQQISPPRAGPNRRAGLLGTRRQGLAHYPLDQPRFGPPSRG
jgi:Winged helix-turn helix